MNNEQNNTWNLVSDALPKAGFKVLVCGRGENGPQWRTTAKWHPAGTLDASTWDEVPDDWEDDTNPLDVWWESTIEGEVSYELSDVTHWMPLPALPNAQDQTRGASAPAATGDSRPRCL